MGYGMQAPFANASLQDFLAQRRLRQLKEEAVAREIAQQQFQNQRVTSQDDLAKQLLARKLGIENVGLMQGQEPDAQTLDRVPGAAGAPAIPGISSDSLGQIRLSPAQFAPQEVPGVQAAGVPSVRLRPRTGTEMSRQAEDTQASEMQRKMDELYGQESIKAQFREPPKSVADIRAEAQARAEGTRAGGGGGGMFGSGGDAEIPGLPPDVSGPEVLNYLPRGEAATVQKLLDYRVQLPSGMALRTPEWRRILAAASMADPNFDAAQYPTRLKTRADFTTGKTARVINSLNTAVGHLGSLAKTAEALDNTSIQLWNRAKNFGAAQTGDPKIVEFEIAANAVANELATVFKGTGATDQEIKAWRHTLSTAQSPQQLKGAIDQAIDLLGSRLEALHNQYSQGMNTAEEYNMLSPKSRRVLQGLGVNVDIFDPGQEYILGKPGEKPSGELSAGRVYYDENGNPIRR